jgi:hypothetical protein
VCVSSCPLNLYSFIIIDKKLFLNIFFAYKEDLNILTVNDNKKKSLCDNHIVHTHAISTSNKCDVMHLKLGNKLFVMFLRVKHFKFLLSCYQCVKHCLVYRRFNSLN